MAITREQTAADVQTGGGSTIDVTYDTTPTEGNLLVAAIHGGTAPDTFPTDWTFAVEESLGKTMIWWKIAGASEDNDYVWDMPSNTQAVWAAGEYSADNGWSETSPLVAYSAVSSSSSVTSKSTGTSKSAASGNVVAIASVVMSDGAAVTGESWTNSFSQQENVIVASGNPWSLETMYADKITTGEATFETTLSWTGARDGVKSVLAVFREKDIGDIVQEKSAIVAYETSISVTFDQTATEGNLLVAAAFTGSDGFTTPSGYSVAKAEEHTSNNQWQNIYYKISDGTETSLTLTPAASEEHALSFVEVQNPSASPLDKTNGSFNSTGATTIDPGSTGTLTQADEFAYTMTGNWNGDEDFTIDDGFVEVHQLFNGWSLVTLSAYRLPGSTTALDPTFTFETSCGGWSIAAIATFLLTRPSTGSPLPIFMQLVAG